MDTVSKKDAETGGNTNPPKKTARISEKERVLLLEKAVLSGTPEEIRSVLQQVMPVKVSARALGFACRCRDLEIVRLLWEAGCNFSFDRTSSYLLGQYALYCDVRGERYFADYSLFCIVKDVRDSCLFGDLEKFYPRGRKSKGKLPDCFAMADAQQRAATVDWLCRQKVVNGKQLDLMLYYALLEDAPEIAAVLKNHGARLTALWLFVPNATTQSQRRLFERAVKQMDEARQAALFRCLAEATGASGRKVAVTKSLIGCLHQTPAVIGSLLENASWKNIGSEKLLQEHIEKKRPAAVFSMYLQAGFVTTAKLLQTLTEASVAVGTAEITAALLEYQNTAGHTLIREAPVEDLSDTLPDITETAIDWDTCYTRNADGHIIRYHGTCSSIEVPYCPGKSAFRFCTFLEEVNIHEGVTLIDAYAFGDCTRLQKITLPSTLLKISSCAFAGCYNLHHIYLPKSVKSISFDAFGGCSNLTIHAPAGSYGEFYARGKQFRFVAE